MKTILVIGGDSFIGSNFISKFYKNYNFRVVSRKKTKIDKELVLNDFFEMNDELFYDVDVLMNFAAIVHRTKKINDLLYKKINFDLPVFLFNKSKKFGVNHFVQMSSIAVYKRNKRINILSSEMPSSSYGIYKLKTDNFLLKSTAKNLVVTCIRPPMVYGGSAPGNMQRLIKIAKLPLPLPFKNVENKLSFINIENLIDFINIVVKNKIINIVIPSDKNETSTKEIIQTVRRLQNKAENLFSMPNFVHMIVKFSFPNFYSKLFESLTIDCNVDDYLYKPKRGIYDGILKTLSK